MESCSITKSHNVAFTTKRNLFLFWFTDGEGCFSITLNRTYIRFRFKINLHIDDLEAVNIIKSKLKVIIEI